MTEMSARSAAPRAQAVRRSDRRRRSRPRAASRTSARPTASGRSTTRWSTRRSTPSAGSGEGLGLLCAAARRARVGGAERRAPRARASSSRAASCQAIVTQNVDRLHERAGASGRRRGARVDPRRRSCLELRHDVRLDGVVELLRDTAVRRHAAPCSSRTSSCSASCCPSPRSTVRRARARARRCCSSSAPSLEVHPVAVLPEETPPRAAALAIVNRGRPRTTPRDAVVDGSAGEVLRNA